jgi:hypothetical protein
MILTALGIIAKIIDGVNGILAKSSKCKWPIQLMKSGMEQ